MTFSVTRVTVDTKPKVAYLLLHLPYLQAPHSTLHHALSSLAATHYGDASYAGAPLVSEGRPQLECLWQEVHRGQEQVLDCGKKAFALE